MERLHLFAKIILLLVFVPGFKSFGQDPSLTNFHINKNHLNPAYAGYSGDFSLNMNNRMQWVKLSSFRQFNTYTLAANVGCEDQKVGLAAYAYDNVEGEGFLRTTMAGVQMARYWPFNYLRNGSHRKTNSSIIAAGAQVGVGQKRLDWEKLTFSDQLSTQTYQMVRNSSAVNPKNQMAELQWDLAGGVRMMSEWGDKASYSFGFAAFHILSNQESFFSANNDVQLPWRYTAHFLVNRNLGKRARKNKWVGSIGGIYNRQANLNSFTVMSYASYANITKFSLGYRGTSNGLPDAIILQGSLRGEDLWDKNDWLLTLSYEFTSINSVGQHRTYGTFEIGVAIVLDNSALCGNSEISCYYPSKDMKKHSIWDY